MSLKLWPSKEYHTFFTLIANREFCSGTSELVAKTSQDSCYYFMPQDITQINPVCKAASMSYVTIKCWRKIWHLNKKKMCKKRFHCKKRYKVKHLQRKEKYVFLERKLYIV